MAKPLDTADFRAIRMELEPDDFAVSDGKPDIPTNLVDKKTWHGIVDLPDDVSIRTSNHQGTILKNVYILEKLFDCPLHLFLGPDLYFFRQVILNCFHASVLIVTSLTTDEGDDIYTLLNLRDRLSAEYLKPEYRSVFRATLGAIRFRQKTRNLLSKARQLRNQEIAHLLDRDTIVSDAEIEHLPFSLEELQTLRNTLKELFCALSFNATYSMFPAGYSDDPLTNGGLSTDIERVLSMIAD